MKVLFSIRRIRYLGYFESTIRLLSERGQRVCLVLEDDSDLVGCLPVAQLEALPGVTVHKVVHERAGAWFHIRQGVRRLADYRHYRDRRYDGAHRLRERAARGIPAWCRQSMDWLPLHRPWARRALGRGLEALEMALPPEASAATLFQSLQPDLVLLTPYIDFGSNQTEFIKLARRHGIPSVVCVHSWDNLTTKGSFRLRPDWVTVWNEFQRQEATELHLLRPGRVLATGAACFDHWFERRPSQDRAAFFSTARLGPANRLLLVYACSSQWVIKDEVPLVRRWVGELRRSAGAALRDAAILVRPYPRRGSQWERADLSDLGVVTAWPRDGEYPANEDSRTRFYDSLHHAAAVMGLNTSAQIEAAIIGRPVFTVRDPLLCPSDESTPHFKHLTDSNGGLVYAADSLSDHVKQLEQVLRRPEESTQRCRDFVVSFLRPHGLERPATPVLVDAIEQIHLRSAAEQGRGRPSAAARRSEPAPVPSHGGRLNREVW